jgi:hypothetical protein
VARDTVIEATLDPSLRSQTMAAYVRYRPFGRALMTLPAIQRLSKHTVIRHVCLRHVLYM